MLLINKKFIVLAPLILSLCLNCKDNKTNYTLPIPAESFTISQIGNMSVERAAHQATLLKTGEVLITGGCTMDGCDQTLASVELYIPDSQTIKDVSPMTTPRASHSAVALSDERVLVSGGWTGTGATASAEIYNPSTDKWISAGNMTQARVSHISIRLQDNRVFIMGGGSGGLGNLSTAEIFDPATGVFTKAEGMHSNHYLATLLKNGKVLMTGGQNEKGEIFNSAEIYDPSTGKFQETGRMAFPRVKHAAVVMQNGNVLIIGGSDEGGYSERYSSTEIYDSRAGTFSSGPKMQYGRHKIRDAVITLPSGNIIVAGGAAHPEIFNSSDNNFETAEGKLSGPQMFATATLLLNGEVLILGGYNDRTQPSSEAWLMKSKL